MITFSHMHPTPSNWRHDLVLPFRKWQDAEQDVLRLAETLKIKVFACNAAHHADPLYQCGTMQMESMHVDNQGNLIFCCSLSHYRNECGGPRREILGNLREMSLFEGTRRMLEKVKSLQLARMERIEKGTIRARHYHPCLVCHDFFGNLDWWEKENR
jgi:hypothetical protein